MERIGIFGGMFDPPHIGHVRAAEAAISQLGLDKLYVIPDHTAPSDRKIGFATPEDRLELTKLAFADTEKTTVSAVAVENHGVVYTADLVEHISNLHPQAELFLLLGADKLQSLRAWRGFDRMCRQVTFAVMFRGVKGEQENVEALRDIGAKVQVLDAQTCVISSKDVRRLLIFHCAKAFLNPSVTDYIDRNSLYGVWEDFKNLPMERLEQVVISLLKKKRINHVLGCRDTAVALAKRWGTDETDAARAGLLHDVTKALDGPLQLTICAEYGTILDDFSTENPKTLHAFTGSLVARDVFGENEAVISAIRSHTTGKGGMNTLEKIIYVADYMEPNRDFPGVEELRRLAFEDLDAALKMGLHMTLEHLRKQGAEVSPATRDALNYLNLKG